MTDFFSQVSKWLSVDGKAHTLDHCIGGTIETVIMIVLSSAVIVGYLIISESWKKAEKNCTSKTAISALREMRFIFVACALCGYGFPILKVWFPWWRPYLFFLFLLVLFTWRYVSKVSRLKIIYAEFETLEKIKSEAESDSNSPEQIMIRIQKIISDFEKVRQRVS